MVHRESAVRDARTKVITIVTTAVISIVIAV